MRVLNRILLLAGLALLGAILWRTDLRQVAALVVDVGLVGFALVVAAHLVSSLIDAFTWQLTIPSVPCTVRWWIRLFNVRVAGEAFNMLTPAGGMGGEPVKALLLRHCHGVGMREGIASLVLARTINVIALLAFLAVGFSLMLGSDAFATPYKRAAGTGLALLAVGVLLFFAIQRFRLTSLLMGALGRHPRFLRLATLVEHLEDIDERFLAFYGRSHRRFASSLVLAWIAWLVGAAEVWVAMAFLGHPVSFSDALVVEAVAQLVRTATFLVPASIGAQEATFLVMGTALTGSPVDGVALAAIRRARELVMVLWGLVLFQRLNAGRGGPRPAPPCRP